MWIVLVAVSITGLDQDGPPDGEYFGRPLGQVPTSCGVGIVVYCQRTAPVLASSETIFPWNVQHGTRVGSGSSAPSSLDTPMNSLPSQTSGEPVSCAFG